MQVSACRPPAVREPAGWGGRGKGTLGSEVAEQRQAELGSERPRLDGYLDRPKSNPPKGWEAR